MNPGLNIVQMCNLGDMTWPLATTISTPVMRSFPWADKGYGCWHETARVCVPAAVHRDCLAMYMQPLCATAVTCCNGLLGLPWLPQPGWFRQCKFIFSQSWRLEDQDQGLHEIWYLLNPLSLVWRWPHSNSISDGLFLCVDTPLGSLCVVKFPPLVRTSVKLD